MAKHAIIESDEEKEELVAIARKHGFDKVANRLIGGEEEDEGEEEDVDFLEMKRLPSQGSRQVINDTLRWMGCTWGDN